MKKNIVIVAVTLLIGLLLGYFIFNDTSQSPTEATEHNHGSAAQVEMWTCSMHPQIMQSEPGQCPICGMDLIPAVSGDASISSDQIQLSENALALANVSTTIIGAGVNGDQQLTLSGKIVQNKESNAVQASFFDGRIEELNVSYEGQTVKKGSRLATLYAPSLVAAQQELITASSLKETQPALYQAVRKKLKLWKLSDSQINTIESTGKVLEYFPIYATVSGTVTEVVSREGDYVKQGQPILMVSNLSNLWAEFDAYESQIPLLKTGLPITITTNAFPGREFKANISFVDPILNTRTRTTTVRATLTNNEGLFKPGMFVKGIIETSTGNGDKAITIPASAVLWTGERSLVYVKPEPGTAIFELREVKLGVKQGDQYVIKSGLTNGEEVVTNGTFTVDAAAQLQGKRSMMNLDKPVNSKIFGKMEMTLSKSFEKSFKVFLDDYIRLKDAFVASNATAISAVAQDGLKQLKQLNSSVLESMAQSHLEKSIQMMEAIVENEELENQRTHFVLLNENLVALAQNVESFENDLYVQYCPMANNNKGAFWLSRDKEVLNPYYGDLMLNCGEVVEKLPL